MTSNNFHLTLLCIIKYQDIEALDRIVDYQNRLSNAYSHVNSFVGRNTVYKYPRQTIHFSFVNFLPPVAQTPGYNRKKYEGQHFIYIKKITDTIAQPFFNSENKRVVIKNTYLGKESLALQAFPSKDLLALADNIVKSIETVEGYPLVKGFPPEDPERFAVNIIRFFRKTTEAENDRVKKIREEIDKELSINPIEFQLEKLSLVISDNYLANEDPVVMNFKLS